MFFFVGLEFFFIELYELVRNWILVFDLDIRGVVVFVWIVGLGLRGIIENLWIIDFRLRGFDFRIRFVEVSI